ncbi:MAG: ankyrin repeat domain-containing protein, partial [Polyangiaceae bacterium]
LVTGQTLLGALLAVGRPRLSPLEATLLTCFALGTGNVVWFVQSGMEATAFIALSVVIVAGLVRLSHGRDRDALIVAAATFALVWTRPEAAGIVVILGGWIAWRRPPRRGSWIVLAGWALGVGSYALVNLVETGHAAPTTLAGRRWMWLAAEPARSTWARIESVGEQWTLRLRDYTLGVSSDVILALAFALALVGLAAFVRRRSYAALLLLAWAAIHLAFYLALLPALGHGGRYEPLTIVAFGLLVARGSLVVARFVVAHLPVSFGSRSALSAVLAGLPAVAFMVASLSVWRIAEPLAIDHVERTEAGLAIIFDALPSDAKIASFDIGASGFRTTRPLLDLGGLTDSSILPYLQNGTVWQWLKRHDVGYVAIPLGYDDAFPDLFNFGYRLHLFDNPAIKLEPVAFLSSTEAVWLPGIGATMHSAPRQGVYRVTYPAAPPPVLRRFDVSSTVVDDAHLLDADERRAVDYRAAAMAAAGVPIEVRIGRSLDDSPAEDDRRLVLAVGHGGARVRLPASLSRAGEERTNRVVNDGIAVYVAAGDVTGEAEASMFLISVVVRRYVDPTFAPLLPPNPYPVQTKRSSGATFEPLAVATLHGPDAIDRWFEDYPAGRRDDRDRYGRTALHVAIGRFDLHALETLLAHGVDVEARDGDGRTPLYLAAKKGFVEAAAALLVAGAKVDSANGPEDDAPLAAAAVAAAPSLVENLLAHGADLSRRNAWAQTALFAAARGPSVHAEAVVPLLLARGADVRVADRQGFTALHVAAAHDEVGTIRLLL